MNIVYRNIAFIGIILFSGVAFAAEEGNIDASEKPISEVIDTSFVEEEVFVKPEENSIKGEEIFVKDEYKDEYYDTLEDNIFYNTEIKTKGDVSEGNIGEDTVYTLDMIKRTSTDDEFAEVKPSIIDGGEPIEGEFVEVKPDIFYDEDGVVIKPEPPFIDDSESFPVPPIMTIGGGELPESEWVYMTGEIPPYVYQTAMPSYNHTSNSGGNTSVSEPFAMVAVMGALTAFMAVRRRKVA